MSNAALLATYRAKLAADQLSDDELREAITILRGERQVALSSSRAKKSPVKDPAIDTDELLKGLFS